MMRRFSRQLGCDRVLNFVGTDVTRMNGREIPTSPVHEFEPEVGAAAALSSPKPKTPDPERPDLLLSFPACRKSLGFFLLLQPACLCHAFAKDNYQRPGRSISDRDGEKWAEKTLHKLSLEEKVGQVFMIWCRASFLNLESPEYLQLREAIQKYHVGSFAMTVHVDGPFLLRSEPYEAAELLNRLQQDSKLPLLFAADLSAASPCGLSGTTILSACHGIRGGRASWKMPRTSAASPRRKRGLIGMHWNFFPDADVNSNPANPIINTRSFGEDPKQVGDLVAAYIKGAHEGGMLATVKHFPGHGDTATDSHLGVAQRQWRSRRISTRLNCRRFARRSLREWTR